MKKILVLALALLLTVSAFGCNKDDTPWDEETPSWAEGGDVEKKKMTLDDVKALSEKGNAITWNDLRGYENGGDIGSGLYILKYEIDDNFYLLVGSSGPSLDAYFSYIYLCLENDEKTYIDIRTEDVESFIKENQ